MDNLSQLNVGVVILVQAARLRFADAVNNLTALEKGRFFYVLFYGGLILRHFWGVFLFCHSGPRSGIRGMDPEINSG